MLNCAILSCTRGGRCRGLYNTPFLQRGSCFRECAILTCKSGWLFDVLCYTHMYKGVGVGFVLYSLE